MGAAKIVANALGAFLGVAFLMAGTMKITDLVDADLHQELTEHFVQYFDIWKVNEVAPGKTPQDFQDLVGLVELFCGLVLLFPVLSAIVNVFFVPLGYLVNWVLIVIMAGAIYTHAELKETITPPLVLFTLLVLYTIFSALSLGGAKPPTPQPEPQSSSATSKKTN